MTFKSDITVHCCETCALKSFCSKAKTTTWCPNWTDKIKEVKKKAPLK